MKNLLLEPTRRTPKVEFDPEAGVYRIEGHSLPENAMDFYAPVFDWVSDYAAELSGPADFHLRLRDVNTSSLKCVLHLMNLLESARVYSPGIRVTWHCDADDPDMMEIGEDIQNLVALPVQVLAQRPR